MYLLFEIKLFLIDKHNDIKEFEKQQQISMQQFCHYKDLPNFSSVHGILDK